MAERLFGLETEYALVLLDRQGQRMDPAKATHWLLDAARRNLIHLPDVHSSGIFLTNGARLYIDCGAHPEFAGPEVANPWDAARYIKAGERILERLGACLASEHDSVGRVCLSRQNVDYSGTGATWGSHESYLLRADPTLFGLQLIPFLVSRLIFTGAGGFDSTHPGLRFTLSPRVPHLTSEMSADSTHHRGVLHTKNESLSSAGYHRLHLLCSESLFSEWAIFLRVGVTALVVAMIEAGLRPADELGLRKPLEAMRSYASDASCQQAAPQRRGEPLTALAIQHRYCALAEAHVRASFMPPWAAEVCREWRRALNLLETGSPESVAAKLDWAIRFSVFSHYLQDQGYTWPEIERWNTVAEGLGQFSEAGGLRRGSGAFDPLWDGEGPIGDLVPELESHLSQNGVSVGEFRRFRALRSRLFELDTRFGELGGDGLFSQLDRAGVLQQHFPGVDNFEHAIENPPALGRAGLRGDCVRRFGRANSSRHAMVCDWAGIWDRPGCRFLDLADPFVKTEDWKIVRADSTAGLNPLLINRYREIMGMLD